jgi:hypothetical protein
VQLSGAELRGTFDFVDAENGWFLLDPYRGNGLGGGAPDRTVLYHTTDGGGGPIGVEPTISLPDVGASVAGSNGPWPLAIALAALGASLAIAGASAKRRNRRA